MEPVTGRIIEIGAIDNDRMLLDGMAAWIASVPDIRLVETAASVSEYLAAPRRSEIVLLDLNLEDFTDPVTNVARLVSANRKVVVMSVIPDSAYVAAATEAGAVAYVTKNNNLAVLADVIRKIAAGASPMTIEHAFLLSRDGRPTRPHLSTREAEVLHLYASGMTLEAVARRVGIAAGTARTYLERVKSKYAEVGRPISSRVDYPARIREDRFGRERIPSQDEHGGEDVK